MVGLWFFILSLQMITMVSQFLLGLGLGILMSIVSSIWVEQMFRCIDKKESWFRFLISTVVVIIMTVFVFYFAFSI